MSSRRVIVICTASAIIVSCLGYRYLSASPGPFVEDDSYFYAQIAYNIGVNHRSTFDGIHITDGYHLLWGWLLGETSFLFAFFTSNKDIHLTAFLSLYLALILSTSILFGRSWAERALLIAVGIWSAFLMESALLTLLLLYQLRVLVSDRKRHLGDDALLMLIPLTRIDASVIVMVWLLVPLLHKRWPKVIRMMLALVAGICLQLLLMRLLFGHFTTVSSQIKSHHILHIITNLHNVLVSDTLRRIGLILLFFVFALFSIAKMPRKQQFLCILAGPTSFIVIHIVAGSELKSWYTTPIIACFIYIAFSNSTQKIIQLLTTITISLFVITSRIYHVRQTVSIAVASRDFVIELRSIVAPNQHIFHVDGGGYIGYHSARNVINGDGLVNTHDYAYRLRSHQLRDYLCENDVSFVIVNFPPQAVGSVLDSYGGMKMYGSTQPILESRAIDWPGNVFWNFRLYSVTGCNK
jgi:hypothetical protein